ncbi:YveK family protein [Paenibacillus soyae]|uniref:Wzz/FepE/Etk N-terminal domain-containing protein n=1 Tax=Paenibacillus soyae TaxID=2969249 RepID=A0A9X2MKT7_9BACL|nr:Wzz/FepE/Etk N-terminal domain-containing protein [Paenibacillus soyae]MCR2802496.1 Wzz/FepE/Etk N-terminal domain-containing protein [Paenibacillus soyae]
METSRKEAFALTKNKEIDLRKLFYILRRKLWLIVLITVILTGLGFIYNSQSEPNIYASSSRVIIAASNDMMPTVRALVREPIVLDQVIQDLGLNSSPGQLRSQVRVDSVDGSLITVISVLDTNPERAANIANAIVGVYKSVAADTLGVSSIRLLTEAEAEPSPINVKSNTIVYVAFVVGLILSISLAFLLESLDDSIRTEHDVEALLGLNMLGQVSKMKRRHTSVPAKKLKPGLMRSETIGS